jgi:hypothetical protein
MPIQKVYLFRGVPDLYADMDGNFFYKDRPARKVYNSGSMAVLCGRSKRGIIKLRKLAYLGEVEVQNLPF